MKSSAGIVMNVEKKQAIIMTNNGEFLKVKIGKNKPNIGEIYSGEIIKEMPFYKYAAIAASLAFILLFSGVSYAYYIPSASVIIDINPSIKLQINRWDKIIKSIPLNKDGEKILSSLNIKNKSLNDGLNLIVEEAKKDNFINDDYIKNGSTIQLTIDNKKGKTLNLSKFESYSKQNNLNVKITTSEENNRNKDNSNKNIKSDAPSSSNSTKLENLPSHNNVKKEDTSKDINYSNKKNKEPKASTPAAESNANINKENKNNASSNNNSSDNKDKEKKNNNLIKQEENNKQNNGNSKYKIKDKK